QMVTDWLWRSGRPEGLANPSATGWTVNFARFMQGLGTLAGGRLDVNAGRDVLNLSASVPTIGRQVGGTTPASSRVEVIGGGRLQVDAGRNMVDGKFFVGGGELVLRAGDSIMNDSAMPETSAGTLIALGDAQVSALARRDLLVGSILNPTLLPQGISQQIQESSRSTFSTYGSDSAARLFAVGGKLDLLNDTGVLGQQLASSMSAASFGIALRTYPPSLSGVAFDGDVDLRGTLSLFPDAAGRFELLANHDITTRGPNAVEVLMSNADPALMPTVAAPQPGFPTNLLETAINSWPDFNARFPVHAGTNAVAHIVARLGDIAIESGGSEDASGFYFPMPARFAAGRDIRDLSLTVIHPGELSTTTLQAGRDLIYTIERGERGGINRSKREINVDGGGRLEISAGRDVDLQTSSGISTRGDIIVSGVPENGADVRILAGLQGKTPAWQAFSDRYLRDGSVHDAALLAYMARETGSTPVSKSAALAAFAQLPEARRRPLLEEVFFTELRITGRTAAPLGDRGDFTRAYAALTSLFPGSNPDLAAGQVNAYDGDIRLYFSRIYSLDGGGISLLAPGGGINAGLATPPEAFGINKSPSELGIVAQSVGNISIAAFGDTQVNESRIFAADGGNIMIWATRGDIDAGRGAKTAISAPAPSISFDSNGRPTVLFPAALAGSGIQSLATSPGRRPGDVDLFAPRGVVNAGDAGIVAGNLTIAATAVLGANNIQVSGVSVGVPVDAGGLAAGLQGVSNVAASSSNSATASLERGADAKSDAPLASAALGWLEVFVEGFGEEVCKPDDVECLARQRTK
ncbi:MAG TPA: filamentous hemagglutinin family protein, partial [Steroidobacteraceae bacterium]|nr:filamentous hemagglutinin family protein [Steroidobacteraceae bacterium]